MNNKGICPVCGDLMVKYNDDKFIWYRCKNCYRIIKYKENIDKKIAKIIHYPNCWDIMAYPTLSSALYEMINLEGKKCKTCGKKQ